MAILARFFVLLKFVDGPWFLNGIAEYEVRGLASLMPVEWEGAMEWPVGGLNLLHEIIEVG